MAVEIQYYFALVSGVQHSGYTVLHSIKWFPAILVLNWPIYCNDVIGCSVICTLHPRDCSIATDLHSLVPPRLSPSLWPPSVCSLHLHRLFLVCPSLTQRSQGKVPDRPACWSLLGEMEHRSVPPGRTGLRQGELSFQWQFFLLWEHLLLFVNEIKQTGQMDKHLISNY